MFDKDLDRVQQPEGTSEGTQYVVPIWWLEKHTAEIVVDANSPDEATEKVEDMIDSDLDTNSKSRDRDEIYVVLKGISVDTRRVLNLLGCEPRAVRGRDVPSSAEATDIETEPVITRRQRRFEEVPVETGTLLGITDPVERTARYAS